MRAVVDSRVGVATAVGLGAAAALHAVWTTTPWPCRDAADFAELVVGVPEAELPAPALTWAVAGALGAASYLVGAESGALPKVGPQWLRSVGVRTVAGVLLARGAGGPLLFGSGRIPRTERFRALDRRVYAPLCLALGTGAVLAARRSL